MSFIGNDSYAFTGREMKAIAKFCGEGGRLITCGRNLYAMDKKSMCAIRIQYHEESSATYINGTRTTLPKYMLDDMQKDFLMIPAVLIPKTLKVGDVVRIHTDGKMSINGDFSAGCTADEPNDGWEACKKSSEFLDRLFDGGELVTEPEMTINYEAMVKLGALMEGFKFHSAYGIDLSIIDTQFHNSKNTDGDIVEHKCLRASIVDSSFGGTPSLGKRGTTRLDFVYMGITKY